MPLGHDRKQCSLDFVRAFSEYRLVDKFVFERRRQQVSGAMLWSVCQVTLTPKATLPASRWVKRTQAHPRGTLGENSPTDIIPDILLFGGWPCPWLCLKSWNKYINNYLSKNKNNLEEIQKKIRSIYENYFTITSYYTKIINQLMDKK